MLPIVLRTRNRILDFDSPLSAFAEFEHLLEHLEEGSRPVALSSGYDVDIYSDDEHIYLEAEIPGLNREDVQVSAEDGVLTVSGKKTHEVIKKDHVHHLQERRFGTFGRSFTLPNIIDGEKIEASMKDGVLRVVLSKRQKTKAKHIEVKGK